MNDRETRRKIKEAVELARNNAADISHENAVLVNRRHRAEGVGCRPLGLGTRGLWRPTTDDWYERPGLCCEVTPLARAMAESCRPCYRGLRETWWGGPYGGSCSITLPAGAWNKSCKTIYNVLSYRANLPGMGPDALSAMVGGGLSTTTQDLGRKGGSIVSSVWDGLLVLGRARYCGGASA